MRHIRLDTLRPSTEWLERAAEAAARIEQIADGLDGAPPEVAVGIREEIKRQINRRSQVWSDLKDELKALSDEKCWYCETREIRSHSPVDHFRPKNAVAECSDHPGYWWLAFDWQNYRYSCTYCNSLLRDEQAGETYGKGTHFPLLIEEDRAYVAANIPVERPCLLDPACPTDPRLLWFQPNGEPTPRVREEDSPITYKRADISIKVYNLREPRIVNARSMIALKIKRCVLRGEKYLRDADNGDPSAQDHLDEVYRELMSAIAPEAEFSAAARAVLATYRDKDWIDDVLRTA